IVGTVVSDDGLPVAGAAVSLHLNREAEIPFLRASALPGSWTKETATDADGRFELADVAEGVWQVEVDHPDFPVVRRNGVPTIWGQRTETAPFVLERPGAIRGVVIDTTGQPVPRVTVNLK